MSKNTGKENIVDLNKVDYKSLTFSKIDTGEKSKNFSQFTSFVNYKKSSRNKLDFKVGPINMVTYGMGDIKYLKGKEDDRDSIKVPIDPEQEQCVLLQQFGDKLTEMVKKSKSDILGSIHKRYDDALYIREPFIEEDIDDDDDDDDNEDNEDDDNKDKELETKPKTTKLKFVRFKFMKDFNTGQILTKFFIKKAGDSKPRPLVVNKPTDVDKLIYRSNLTFICTLSHLSAAKATKQKGEKRFFTFCTKIAQVLIETTYEGPSTGNNTLLQYNLFSNDSDDESDDNNDNEEKTEEKKSDKKSKKNQDSDDDSGDDSENDINDELDDDDKDLIDQEDDSE